MLFYFGVDHVAQVPSAFKVLHLKEKSYYFSNAFISSTVVRTIAKRCLPGSDRPFMYAERREFTLKSNGSTLTSKLRLTSKELNFFKLHVFYSFQYTYMSDVLGKKKITRVHNGCAVHRFRLLDLSRLILEGKILASFLSLSFEITTY